MMLFVMTQPSFRSPCIGVVAKRWAMPIDHIRINANNRATCEESSADRDASVRHYSLKRQTEWRVQAHRLVDTGIEIWQVAHLVPFGERSRELLISLRLNKLFVETAHCRWVREEVVPDGPHHNPGRIGAGNDI